MIPPRQAWHRLARMQQMVAHEPALAWAVSWMPLHDQLDLTLEVLGHHNNSYLDEEPVETSAQQAYALCSVAVDLKISELVDVPNFVTSAFLPLDIFVS